ncbi:MAG: hypothetical protein NTW80_11910, partial [Deltaproteobacteria bacterium]|nr:hypothetical protein [Deltaproteobacteria bacterium]
MFLKGVWCIIAAVLLLGQTPAPAEQYATVSKNGVVYYHFTSREPNQPRQAGKKTPKMRGEAWIQVPSARPKPPLAASKAPLRVKSKLKPAAISPTGPPALTPLIPETAENLPVVNPNAANGLILPGLRYLHSLLTKLGYRYPLAGPAAADLQPVDRHQVVPAVQAPQIVAPEDWKILLRCAQ